jgi:FMN reductase
MKNKLKIAGIGGSMEKKSTTLASLKFVMDEISKLGAETSIFDIAELNFPIYNTGMKTSSSGNSRKAFFDEIHSADGYIFASPEYHGSVSGAFKNVMDYFDYLSDYEPPYLTNKPAGCIAVGGGEYSGVTTLQTMVNIVNNFRAITPSKNVVVAPMNKHFDLDKNLISDIVKARLTRLAKDVYNLAEKLSA